MFLNKGKQKVRGTTLIHAGLTQIARVSGSDQNRDMLVRLSARGSVGEKLLETLD